MLDSPNHIGAPPRRRPVRMPEPDARAGAEAVRERRAPARRHDATVLDKPGPTKPEDPLDRIAKAARTSRAWREDAPLSEGRNAHHTNTPDEMADALEGDFNWLEGDLRLDDSGTPKMSHDADDEDKGLTLDRWLEVGARSKRGMKVDVKEPEALPELLDSLEKSKVHEGRMMINVQTKDVSVGELEEIRRRFPDAWLALNPAFNESESYDESALRETARIADAVGGRIAFPLRWDVASDEAIAILKPHGRISIWTSESQGTPDDTKAEIERLRERGVDGVIDLGPPSPFLDKLRQRGRDVLHSSPVRMAEAVVDMAPVLGSIALDQLGDGIDALRDANDAVLGVAREGASRIPVVGGLFD